MYQLKSVEVSPAQRDITQAQAQHIMKGLSTKTWKPHGRAHMLAWSVALTNSCGVRTNIEINVERSVRRCHAQFEGESRLEQTLTHGASLMSHDRPTAPHPQPPTYHNPVDRH